MAKKPIKAKNRVPKRELILLIQNESLNQQIKNLESSYDQSKRVWSAQEDRMLIQISQRNTQYELLQQEKSNLQEVIEGLGATLGEMKSEIRNLRLFR